MHRIGSVVYSRARSCPGGRAPKLRGRGGRVSVCLGVLDREKTSDVEEDRRLGLVLNALPCRERVTSACLNDLTGGYIRMEQVRPPIVAPVGSGQQTAGQQGRWQQGGRGPEHPETAVRSVSWSPRHQSSGRGGGAARVGVGRGRGRTGVVGSRLAIRHKRPDSMSPFRSGCPCFSYDTACIYRIPYDTLRHPTSQACLPACTRQVPCKRIRRPELPRSRTPRRPPSVQHPWLFPGTGNREETGKPRPCSR